MEDLVMNPQFWKGKRILLTGHTGFKGSWLSIWLQKLGVNLTGYSKSIPTNPSLFELTNAENGMKSIMGDICDASHLQNIINEHRPEIIIHMAAQSIVRRSYTNPVETYATNVMGTVNLLNAIRKSEDVRVVINVTSDKSYEIKDGLQRYREDDSMGGYDPYSSSKGCAELVTSSFRNSFFNADDYSKHKTAIASVRAGNVIGGGDWSEDRLVPDIMRSILQKRTAIIRNPKAIRPWQHVLEPLNGYILLVEKLWNDGPNYTGAWNFGPNEDDSKSVEFIIEKISQKLGERISFKVEKNALHEAATLRLDCNKAKTKLGWSPKINLEVAIEWVVDWYKNYVQNKNIRRYTEMQIENFMRL